MDIHNQVLAVVDPKTGELVGSFSAQDIGAGCTLKTDTRMCSNVILLIFPCLCPCTGRAFHNQKDPQQVTIIMVMVFRVILVMVLQES
jgi:hypothetical protein